MLLIGRPQAPPANPVVAAPASLTSPTAATTTETLDDGRTIHLVGLGGSHTAIYIGNGMMVHASTFGTPVRVAPMDNAPIYNIRRY